MSWKTAWTRGKAPERPPRGCLRRSKINGMTIRTHEQCVSTRVPSRRASADPCVRARDWHGPRRQEFG